jgi:pilus assembly protein CpaC
MEPGQTFAIGGLIQTTTQGAATKVPVIGDLPFIGNVFRTNLHQEQESELIILVTPHLVDAMDCRQAPKRLPGRETRSPDDYELFMEGILEAPRGQRTIFPNGKYKAPYLNDPSSGELPCASPLPRGQQMRDGCRDCQPGGTYAPNGTLPVIPVSPTGPAHGPVPEPLPQPAPGGVLPGGPIPAGPTGEPMPSRPPESLSVPPAQVPGTDGATNDPPLIPPPGTGGVRPTGGQ